MASNSGLFLPTWIDILDATQLSVDLTRADIYCAMFNNTALTAANYSTDTGYGTGSFASNEVTGTGYTAGGVALSSAAVSESPSGTLKWTAANAQWTSSTISNAYCALIYATNKADGTAFAGSAKPAIVLVNFGSAYSTTSGTFTIQWSGSGIFTIDLTP